MDDAQNLTDKNEDEGDDQIVPDEEQTHDEEDDDDDDLTIETADQEQPEEQVQSTVTTSRKPKPTDVYVILLRQQMAQEKLTDAIRCGNRDELERAVENYERVIGDTDEGEADKIDDMQHQLKQARFKLRYIDELKAAIDDAIENKLSGSIQTCVDLINEARLKAFFRPELRRADELLHKREHRVLLPILAMDRHTMTEMKRYSNPHPVVHRVMQAAFLLLGFDEGQTADWRRCQTLCTPDGPQGLNRRMSQFNAADVDLFIRGRVQEMVDYYEIPDRRSGKMKKVPFEMYDVQRASPGAATFYVWVQSVLEELSKDEDDSEDTSTEKPAPSLPDDLEKWKYEMQRIVAQEVAIFRPSKADGKKQPPPPATQRNASPSKKPQQPRGSVYYTLGHYQGQTTSSSRTPTVETADQNPPQSAE